MKKQITTKLTINQNVLTDNQSSASSSLGGGEKKNQKDVPERSAKKKTKNDRSSGENQENQDESKIASKQSSSASSSLVGGEIFYTSIVFKMAELKMEDREYVGNVLRTNAHRLVIHVDKNNYCLQGAFFSDWINDKGGESTLQFWKLLNVTYGHDVGGRGTLVTLEKMLKSFGFTGEVINNLAMTNVKIMSGVVVRENVSDSIWDHLNSDLEGGSDLKGVDYKLRLSNERGTMCSKVNRMVGEDEAVYMLFKNDETYPHDFIGGKMTLAEYRLLNFRVGLFRAFIREGLEELNLQSDVNLRDVTLFKDNGRFLTEKLACRRAREGKDDESKEGDLLLCLQFIEVGPCLGKIVIRSAPLSCASKANRNVPPFFGVVVNNNIVQESWEQVKGQRQLSASGTMPSKLKHMVREKQAVHMWLTPIGETDFVGGPIGETDLPPCRLKREAFRFFIRNVLRELDLQLENNVNVGFVITTVDEALRTRLLNCQQGNRQLGVQFFEVIPGLAKVVLSEARNNEVKRNNSRKLAPSGEKWAPHQDEDDFCDNHACYDHDEEDY